MKKVVCFFFAFICICCFSRAFAAPWAVVATNYTDPHDPDLDESTIQTIDLGVMPPKVYGPFLNHQLGSHGGGLFDLAMLPGQRFAIVSNFGDSKIFLIDLKDPKAPVVKGSVKLSFFAEDIAVSPDGRLALVTDGGFSSKVAFVDLKTFTLKNEFDTGDMQAQAVAIGPDNTVLLADYWNGAVNYGTINAAKNGLDNMKTVCLCDAPMTDTDNCSTCSDSDRFGRPVNVEISPNGKTALVANSVGSNIAVLEIKGPGEVVRGNPFFIQLGGDWDNSSTPEIESRGGDQCIQFQSDARAYVLRQPVSYCTSSPCVSYPNELWEIQVKAPGKAAAGSSGPIHLVSYGTSQMFGVDSFGIAGGQALVGNPTFSGAQQIVSYINLVTGAMTPVKVRGLPTGVGMKLW